MENQPLAQEDDIDLSKYIGVIIKRKYLILIVFLVSVTVTSVANSLKPKIYEVSMIIQPPIMYYTDTGVQNLDTVENIQAKINAGVYSGSIIKDLEENNSFKGNSLGFNVSQPKDSDLLRISMEEKENETGLGIAALNDLLKSIRSDYLDIIGNKQDEIDRKIALINNQINTKDSEIALSKEQLVMQEETEAKLLDEMRKIKPNADRLDIAFTIQLQDELNNLRIERENTEEKNENLISDIYLFRNDIEEKNTLKKGIHNVALVQEPQVSLEATKSNKKKNIIISAVFGLFLGTFLAFFMDPNSELKR